MDYYTEYKTFIRGYQTLYFDHRKFKTFYKDRRLTQVEKQILKGLYNLKKGKYKDAVQSLKDLSISNPLLNGFRLIILSACFNNSMQLELALKSAKLAFELFQSINDKRFVFHPLTQVIVALGNQKNLSEMEKYVKMLDSYERNNDVDEGSYCKCMAFYHLLKEEPEKSLEYINTALEQHYNGVKDRLAYFYVVKFMAEFKLKRIEECEQTLQKYKTLSGYKVKANFKFMNSMLKFIYHNSPIYCYLNDFKTTPSLGHELLVIKNLVSGDLDTAKAHWDILHKFNPPIYRENFKFSGDYCLFSVALSKFDIEKLFKRQRNEVKDFMSDENYLMLKSYQQKLEYILRNSDGLVSCDKLIYFLWGEKADYSAIKKLKTQVSRLRSKKGLDIVFENDGYYLNSETKLENH